MLGSVLGIIQDTASGFTREAMGRCTAVGKEIDKREYSARQRWGYYHWCGKAFFDAGYTKEALRLLLIAEKYLDAPDQRDKEQTVQLLRQIEEKSGKKADRP